MEPYYRIRLDDLLGRDLTVQWFEGVAIVQGVCRQILAGSAERGFPSLAGICVCANGAIELVGTASSSQSVAAAGHTLSQMLGEDAPVRLRLVASQATAGDGGYHTLQEFSDAVAYFERPDAESILRNLHQRASLAASRGDVAQEFVPTVTPEQKAEQPRPVTKGRPNWLVPAGVAGAILCVAVWRLPLSSQGTAASAVATTVQNAVRSTLARVAPAESVVKDDVKLENKVTSKPPTKSAGRRLGPRTPRNEAEGRTGRNVNARPGAAMPGLLPIRPLAVTTSSRPDVVYDMWPDGSQAPALYTALNAEVVPPKSVYPKLPAAPPSGFSLPGQTVLEMVIGTNGLVERVKLRTDPRNVHEFMLVSAAKAWVFEPARLRGTPVRYLHTVILTLQ